MRYFDFFAAVLLTIAVIIVNLSQVSAGERLGFPPPDPPGTVREPLTQQSLQKEVDNDLRQRFEEAAGHSNHLLTAQGAKDAGWGFMADHFAEIDDNRDGYLQFSEISGFMTARSPVVKSKSKAPPSVQTIE